MAASGTFKRNTRQARNVTVEDSFSNGVYVSDTPIAPGYSRALVNYRVDFNTKRLVNRPGLSELEETTLALQASANNDCFLTDSALVSLDNTDELYNFSSLINIDRSHTTTYNFLNYKIKTIDLDITKGINYLTEADNIFTLKETNVPESTTLNGMSITTKLFAGQEGGVEIHDKLYFEVTPKYAKTILQNKFIGIGNKNIKDTSSKNYIAPNTNYATTVNNINYILDSQIHKEHLTKGQKLCSIGNLTYFSAYTGDAYICITDYRHKGLYSPRLFLFDEPSDSLNTFTFKPTNEKSGIMPLYRDSIYPGEIILIENCFGINVGNVASSSGDILLLYVTYPESAATTYFNPIVKTYLNSNEKLCFTICAATPNGVSLDEPELVYRSGSKIRPVVEKTSKAYKTINGIRFTFWTLYTNIPFMSGGIIREFIRKCGPEPFSSVSKDYMLTNTEDIVRSFIVESTTVSEQYTEGLYTTDITYSTVPRIRSSTNITIAGGITYAPIITEHPTTFFEIIANYYFDELEASDTLTKENNKDCLKIGVRYKSDAIKIGVLIYRDEVPNSKSIVGNDGLLYYYVTPALKNQKSIITTGITIDYDFDDDTLKSKDIHNIKEAVEYSIKDIITEYNASAKNVIGIFYTIDESKGKLNIKELEAYTPSASIAVTTGYNMLLKDPYTFENRVGTLGIDGCLLYDSDDNVKTVYRAGENLIAKLYYSYQDKDKDKSYVVLKMRTQSSETYIDLVPGNCIIKGAPIEFPITIPNEPFYIFIKLYDDAGNEVYEIELPYNVSKEVTQLQTTPKYNLYAAQGLCAWKNRLYLWGVPDAPNIIFASDTLYPTQYFPYPNNIIEYDEPILNVIVFLDKLLVFTNTHIYQTTLGSDGMSWTTETVVGNLKFTPNDMYSIVPIKNMLFYKNANRYYMLVPSTSYVSLGELKTAKISEPIAYLLDDFYNQVLSILKSMYTVDSFKPTAYSVFVDGDIIKINYGLKLDPDIAKSRDIMFVINYDTLNRIWYYDIITMPSSGSIKQYTQHLLGASYYTFCYPDKNTIKIKMLAYKNNEKDFHIDELVPLRQFYDSGYKDINPEWKKRFREIQFKVSQPESKRLYFRPNFILDEENRLQNKNYMLQLIGDGDYVYAPSEEYTAYGKATLEPSEPSKKDEEYFLELGGENFDSHKFNLLRCKVSGKGYYPRFQIVGNNQIPYEIHNVNWVFRNMNLR